MKTLEEIRRDHDRPMAPHAFAMTRLDVPFSDVFVHEMKVFVARVIIGAPFALIVWLAFLR